MSSEAHERLGEILAARGLRLVTAESCTGGLIASWMTRRGGSSRFFERGYVTYSNEAKIEELGVKAEVLAAHGAVSAQVAAEMAHGALENSRADVAVSVTGIAGPEGGSAEKPVGLVYFGFARRGQEVITAQKHFSGDREAVQNHAARAAIEGLIEVLS